MENFLRDFDTIDIEIVRREAALLSKQLMNSSSQGMEVDLQPELPPWCAEWIPPEYLPTSQFLSPYRRRRLWLRTDGPEKGQRQRAERQYINKEAIIRSETRTSYENRTPFLQARKEVLSSSRHCESEGKHSTLIRDFLDGDQEKAGESPLEKEVLQENEISQGVEED